MNFARTLPVPVMPCPLLSWFAANGVTDLTGQDDKDFDGPQDLLEYALGTDPSAHNSNDLATGTTSVATQDHMTFVLTHAIGRDDVLDQGESGTTLTRWGNAVFASSTPNFTTGTENTIWRHPAPSQHAPNSSFETK